MKSACQTRIEQLAPAHDPRHVEAYMRAEHGTLDALSAGAFRAEVAIAVACIDQGGPAMAEQLAASFGLRP